MGVRDWFGRDKERNYVAGYSGRRLQWDFGMSNSYSSFFAPDLNKQKLIKDSFKHVCDVRDIMEIPKSVKINLYAEQDSYSTANEVVISTSVFDDKTLNNNQKLDIFLGLAIHEFSHILYTKLNERNTTYRGNSYSDQLANVIEDERIEGETIKKYPGYANFLKEVKYYYFDLKFKEEHVDDVIDVLQTVLYLVRYPGRVNEDIYNRHKPLFDRIREDVLFSLGESFQDSVRKANIIWDLICDYFHIPHDPPESNSSSNEGNEESKDSQSGQGNSEQNSSSSKNSSNTGDSSSSNKDNSKSNSLDKSQEESTGKEKDKSKENSSQETKKDSDRENKPGGGPSKTGKISAVSEEQLRRAGERVASKMRSIGAGYNGERCVEINSTWIAKEYAGDLIRERDDLIFSKQDNNETVYLKDKEQIGSYINPLVNAFNKFFIEQEYKLTGLRRGKLDTNKLVEAFQNVDTVYNQSFKRTTPGLDICLLIDESGSMYGSKIRKARMASILLNEVCLKLPKCNLYIYGHTADIIHCGDTMINVYRDSWNKNKYALGSVADHSNNRDHEAIKEVHKLVRKQTKNPLLMFVISDGYPSANGLGSVDNGIKQVKKVVNDIEARGDTIICQIAIEDDINSSKMFNHYITLTKLDTFPKDLSNYILKVLVSKLKRVDI